MKKFISGILLLSLIFFLSVAVMFRTQVSEPKNTPEENPVYAQPAPTVHEPVENLVETVEFHPENRRCGWTFTHFPPGFQLVEKS